MAGMLPPAARMALSGSGTPTAAARFSAIAAIILTMWKRWPGRLTVHASPAAAMMTPCRFGMQPPAAMWSPIAAIQDGDGGGLVARWHAPGLWQRRQHRAGVVRQRQWLCLHLYRPYVLCQCRGLVARWQAHRQRRR